MNKSVKGKLLKLRSACFRNAEELLAESNILFSHGKYSRAVFLAITAVEETCKVDFVSYLISGTMTSKEFNSNFTAHFSKLGGPYNIVVFEDLKTGEIVTKVPVAQEREKRGGIHHISLYKRASIEKLKELRERCLYVEQDKSAHSLKHEPSQIDFIEAQRFIQEADKRIQDRQTSDQMLALMEERLKQF